MSIFFTMCFVAAMMVIGYHEQRLEDDSDHLLATSWPIFRWRVLREGRLSSLPAASRLVENLLDCQMLDPEILAIDGRRCLFFERMVLFRRPQARYLPVMFADVRIEPGGGSISITGRVPRSGIFLSVGALALLLSTLDVLPALGGFLAVFGYCYLVQATRMIELGTHIHR